MVSRCLSPVAEKFSFSSDKEILHHAVEHIQNNSDFESVLCAELENSEPLELASEHNLSGASPQFVISNLEWFSCLFVLDASSKGPDLSEQSAFEEMEVDEEDHGSELFKRI